MKCVKLVDKQNLVTGEIDYPVKDGKRVVIEDYLIYMQSIRCMEK